MRNLRYILLVTILFSSIGGYGQNVHFSQYFQTPLLVNPALTGVFNGDIRGVVNYRNQWASVSDPFTTYAFSYDMGIRKKKNSDKYIGAGINFYRDVAGDTKYATTAANLSVSSVITLGAGHNLSAGLQGGFAQKSIDESTFQWGSQFDGTSHNAALISGEPTTFEPYAFGDFSAGVSWSFGKEAATLSSNNGFSANAGVAVYHANAPKLEFDNEALYRELVVHAGTYIGIKNTPFSILPNLLILKQGPSMEINVGALARYSIREESKYTGFLKETAFFFGAFSRAGDALIPTVMFEFANYALGMSYDVNTSDLKTASNGNGALEISLRFINPNPFKYGKGSKYQHRSLF